MITRSGRTLRYSHATLDLLFSRDWGQCFFRINICCLHLCIVALYSIGLRARLSFFPMVLLCLCYIGFQGQAFFCAPKLELLIILYGTPIFGCSKLRCAVLCRLAHTCSLVRSARMLQAQCFGAPIARSAHLWGPFRVCVKVDV